MSLESRRAAARAAREAALESLARTRNVTRAARAAGRCRQTVHEWLREPGFQAELERRRDARARAFFAQVMAPEAESELVLHPAPELMDRLLAAAHQVGEPVEAAALAALQRGLQQSPCDSGPGARGTSGGDVPTSRGTEDRLM